MAAGGPVELVHLDAFLIVAVKPAGLLAVPGRTVPDCLSARVQAVFDDARVVHRLDMATSGLMLFARGAEMQRRLGRAFEARTVDKRYFAVVHGRMPPCGRIDLPLLADWPNRPRQKVDAAHGKPSSTRFRTIGFDAAANASHVALEPLTGRAHQLRVHLLAIGHPIVGDSLYAPDTVRAECASRLMLHAERLGFVHPGTGASVSFQSTPPFEGVDSLSNVSIMDT